MPLAQRAVELMPNNADVLDTLGLVYLKLNRCEEAEKTLRKAKDNYKTPTAVVVFHLCTALDCLGQGDRAKTFLKQRWPLIRRRT